MKKILIFMVVIAVAMGGYVYKKKSSTKISSLLLENIEALADRAIYTVFHGRSFKDIARDAQNGINHPDGGQFIYVFSLTRKPLMKYVLDHYICGISVDEQLGVIYATDVNQDEPILEYSVKTI